MRMIILAVLAMMSSVALADDISVQFVDDLPRREAFQPVSGSIL